MRFHKLGGSGEPRFRVAFHPAAEREFLALPPNEQTRFERAIDGLELDPFRKRPGVDIRKLVQSPDGTGLYRLRVGERRACCAVLTEDREVYVLLFDDRELGYGRLLHTAEERFRRRRL